jgi:uncharacterized protein
MSTHGVFVVPIHDLDVAGKDARFAVARSWVRGALEGCEMQPAGADGLLEVHLTKTGSEVLVQGQLDVELVIPCARCLKPVDLRPHIELSLLLQPVSPTQGAGRRSTKRAPPSSDEAEFATEEADLDTYEGDEVVLDRFVREAILLESPIFPLCSEACEGIRPASETASSSQGAATDPRLLPLLELAKRRNMKE